MASNISYYNKSISNILADDREDVGNVAVNDENGYLSIGAASSTKYTYQFGTANLLNSDKIKLKYRIYIADGSDYISRYTFAIKISLVVTYYKTITNSDGETIGYETGKIEKLVNCPYILSSTNKEEGYKGYIEVALRNEVGIKSIEMYIINDYSKAIKVYYVSMYKSMTTEEVVTNTYSHGLTVTSIEFAPNGLTAEYGQLAMKTVLGCYCDDNGYLNGIVSNPFTDNQQYIDISTTNIPIVLPDRR